VRPPCAADKAAGLCVSAAKVKASRGKQRPAVQLPSGVVVGPKRPWAAALGTDTESPAAQRVCRPSTPPPCVEQPAVPHPTPPLSDAAVQPAAPAVALAASPPVDQ
jgi:hypothetical protein